GWMVAIIVAVLTACGAFLIGLLIEDYKRYRDTQALAAALRSEIRVLLQLVEELKIEENYRGMRDIMQSGRELPVFPTDGLTFPITIYEKCADRVGILGEQEADGVVRFYNFLNGFRTALRLGLSAPSRKQRIDSLTFLLDTY